MPPLQRRRRETDQCVEVDRWLIAAVEADVVPAKVVRQDVHEVRLGRCADSQGRGCGHRYQPITHFLNVSTISHEQINKINNNCPSQPTRIAAKKRGPRPVYSIAPRAILVACRVNRPSPGSARVPSCSRAGLGCCRAPAQESAWATVRATTHARALATLLALLPSTRDRGGWEQWPLGRGYCCPSLLVGQDAAERLKARTFAEPCTSLLGLKQLQLHHG